MHQDQRVQVNCEKKVRNLYLKALAFVGGKRPCAAVAKAKGAGLPCGSLDSYNENDLKALIIKKDAEIIALKNELEVGHVTY